MSRKKHYATCNNDLTQTYTWQLKLSNYSNMLRPRITTANREYRVLTIQSKQFGTVTNFCRPPCLRL